LLCRDTKYLKLRNYYTSYCRILNEVIKTGKKLYHNKLITNSNDKIKTMWNIVKTEIQNALKRFLLDNSFYTLEEYCSWKENVFSLY